MKEVALQHDLELVEKKNFIEFYSESIDANRQLFDRMVTEKVDGKMTEDVLAQQWEICGLYLVFAFRKLGKKTKRIRNNFMNLKNARMVNVKDWR